MPRSIYCCGRSIVSPEGALFAHCWIEQIALPIYKATLFTHCSQSTQFVLARGWIKRDRFLPAHTRDPLRLDRCDGRIQWRRNDWIIGQKIRNRLANSARHVWAAVSRDEACWPRRNARCNCRVRNPESFRGRRAAAGCRARRNIWHRCVDYLSRATLDACEERRDQAERRKSEFFHKSLRLLNITKVSSLQARTESQSVSQLNAGSRTVKATMRVAIGDLRDRD